MCGHVPPTLFSAVLSRRLFVYALRCAAMGFGALHCIMRPTDKYKKSQRTAAGADKWLDTRLWDSTSECLTALKGAGYQMVVTHLSDSSVTVQVSCAYRNEVMAAAEAY